MKVKACDLVSGSGGGAEDLVSDFSLSWIFCSCSLHTKNHSLHTRA